MARYIITVPEAEAAAFMTLMEERGYYYTPSADQDQEPEGDIPEWQQKAVLQRLSNTRPEEFIAWETLKSEIETNRDKKA